MGRGQVANSGVAGNAAVHFIMEAAEPNGPLHIARTYFFSVALPICLVC